MNMEIWLICGTIGNGSIRPIYTRTFNFFK
jgi:hypothetical protein